MSEPRPASDADLAKGGTVEQAEVLSKVTEPLREQE